MEDCDRLAASIGDHPADIPEGLILDVDLGFPEELHEGLILEVDLGYPEELHEAQCVAADTAAHVGLKDINIMRKVCMFSV